MRIDVEIRQENIDRFMCSFNFFIPINPEIANVKKAIKNDKK